MRNPSGLLNSNLLRELEAKVPNLRFPEFESEWDNIILGEICEIRTGGKDTQDKVEDGIYPFYVRSNTIENINSYSFDEEAILTSGDGAGVGKIYHLVSGKFELHQRVYSLTKFEENFSIKFAYYFFSEKFYKRVMRLSAKNSVDSVRRDMIFSMNMPHPKICEQQKIASLLSLIDRRIQTQNEIINNLKLLKKSLLQKIFSQELIFKDEEGKVFPKWKKKELGSLNFYISDGNYGELYPKASEMKSTGIPFIRANNIRNLKLSWSDIKYIAPKHHEVLKSGHLKTDDILITTRGDIGMVAIVKEEFNNSNINAQICLLRCPEGLVPNYILQFLASTYGLKQFKQLQTGSALKQLPKGNLSKVKIPIPSYEEQTKIANLLSSMDRKIEIERLLLDQFLNQKTYLLQNLFI